MGKIAMDRRKNGIFFTFIAIMLVSVFAFVFTPQADISLQKDKQAVRTRILSIDSYALDLENRYFEEVLTAVTYKAALSLIYYINSTGSYVTNAGSAFSEVMLSGRIGGAPIDDVTGKKIMENNTLANWSSRLAEAAKDTLNVDTAITITNVSVFQTKPWSIDSVMIINYTIKSNVAEWKKNITVTSSIPIEGLPDPYYLANTNRAYTNEIKKSTVDFNRWNITKTREHLRNGTYVHWERSAAPDFLMRFTNTISNSSCCGIESLANPNKLSPPDQMESYADYNFWSHKFANNCTQLYNITGLWDEFRYFKLDFEHVLMYNLTANDAVRAC